MQIADQLIWQKIRHDLRSAGRSIVSLEDVVLETPKSILLKSNEVIYSCFFATLQAGAFELEVLSDTNCFKYKEENCFVHAQVNNRQSFSSTVVQAHSGNVKLNFKGKNKAFLFRYIKVTTSEK